MSSNLERTGKPFSGYMGLPFILAGAISILSDYFYRHIPPLSRPYLFDLGLILLGLGLLARGKMPIWIAYTLVVAGGAATIASFMVI